MISKRRNLVRTPTNSINETTDLCVLGLLFRDARTINGLVSAVRMIDTEPWTPTRDVLECSLERLIGQKSVVCLQSGRETYYSVTGTGIRQFFELMKRPMGVGAFNVHCLLALKSTFLEDVPTAIRAKVVQELVGYYSCKLTCLEQDCEECLRGSNRGKVHYNLQVMQIRTELDWLSDVAQSA
ncbi:hypothetical protein [Terasakiella pusilla]|uniref:hypothetical protein n=1 Tax=Terasakiella pusilla TaxID=64973 RepID=UPI003AA998BF